MKRAEFAAQIKAKYPDYAVIDDNELVDKITAKYPDYADMVDEDFDDVQSGSSAIRTPSVYQSSMQKAAAAYPHLDIRDIESEGEGAIEAGKGALQGLRNIPSAIAKLFGGDVPDLPTSLKADPMIPGSDVGNAIGRAGVGMLAPGGPIIQGALSGAAMTGEPIDAAKGAGVGAALKFAPTAYNLAKGIGDPRLVGAAKGGLSELPIVGPVGRGVVRGWQQGATAIKGSGGGGLKPPPGYKPVSQDLARATEMAAEAKAADDAFQAAAIADRQRGLAIADARAKEIAQARISQVARAEAETKRVAQEAIAGKKAQAQARSAGETRAAELEAELEAAKAEARARIAAMPPEPPAPPPGSSGSGSTPGPAFPPPPGMAASGLPAPPVTRPGAPVTGSGLTPGPAASAPPGFGTGGPAPLPQRAPGAPMSGSGLTPGPAASAPSGLGASSPGAAAPTTPPIRKPGAPTSSTGFSVSPTSTPNVTLKVGAPPAKPAPMSPPPKLSPEARTAGVEKIKMATSPQERSAALVELRAGGATKEEVGEVLSEAHRTRNGPDLDIDVDDLTKAQERVNALGGKKFALRELDRNRSIGEVTEEQYLEMKNAIGRAKHPRAK